MNSGHVSPSTTKLSCNANKFHYILVQLIYIHFAASEKVHNGVTDIVILLYMTLSLQLWLASFIS
jgi:hypothetical protein